MNEEKTTLEIIDSSVDAAIERGLEQLGLTRDDIEIEVLDAGSRGILGLAPPIPDPNLDQGRDWSAWDRNAGSGGG